MAFTPYISKETKMQEVGILTILFGLLFACVFAMANVYLALKVGLTIAAGIPSSILAAGFLMMTKEGNPLSVNTAQTMGAIGESIASGAAFSLVSLFIITSIDISEFSFLNLTLILIVGGVLGTYLTVPFRKFIIEDEHDTLPFPESIAIKEIVVNTVPLDKQKQDKQGFSLLLEGIGLGAIFKFIVGAVGAVSGSYFKTIGKTGIGFDISMALPALGLIIGIEVATPLFAGGLLAWFGIIPLIQTLGDVITIPVFPSKEVLISQMDASSIWSNYVKYIGAGAVAGAGFISLARNAKNIISSFANVIAGQFTNKGKATEFTNRSQIEPNGLEFIGILVASLIATFFLPNLGLPFYASVVAIILVIFFAIVAGRMVGVVGSSNLPVSGMTIASILILVFMVKGINDISDNEKILKSLMLVIVVCTGIATAGGTMQSLKVGYLLGASTKVPIRASLLGVIVASIASVFTIMLLNEAYGFIASPEHTEPLAAPQANLFKMITEGIIAEELPWGFILVGLAIAVFAQMLGAPALIVGVGVYLPISTSASIFLGGLVAYIVQKAIAKKETKEKLNSLSAVFASGMIAGDALTGVVIAIFLVTMKGFFPILKTPAADIFGMLMLLGFVGYYLYRIISIAKKEK